MRTSRRRTSAVSSTTAAVGRASPAEPAACPTTQSAMGCGCRSFSAHRMARCERCGLTSSVAAESCVARVMTAVNRSLTATTSRTSRNYAESCRAVPQVRRVVGPAWHAGRRGWSIRRIRDAFAGAATARGPSGWSDFGDRCTDGGRVSASSPEAWSESASSIPRRRAATRAGGEQPRERRPSRRLETAWGQAELPSCREPCAAPDLGSGVAGGAPASRLPGARSKAHAVLLAGC